MMAHRILSLHAALIACVAWGGLGAARHVASSGKTLRASSGAAVGVCNTQTGDDCGCWDLSNELAADGRFTQGLMASVDFKQYLAIDHKIFGEGYVENTVWTTIGDWFKEALGGDAAKRGKLQEGWKDMDVNSCAATMRMMNTVLAKDETPDQTLKPTGAAMKLSAVNAHLVGDNRKLVIVSASGFKNPSDHHFTMVYMPSTGNVQMYQSFVDKYSLNDWMKAGGRAETWWGGKAGKTAADVIAAFTALDTIPNVKGTDWSDEGKIAWANLFGEAPDAAWCTQSALTELMIYVWEAKDDHANLPFATKCAGSYAEIEAAIPQGE